jgi:hypothetical protein
MHGHLPSDDKERTTLQAADDSGRKVLLPAPTPQAVHSATNCPIRPIRSGGEALAQRDLVSDRLHQYGIRRQHVSNTLARPSHPDT